MENVLTGIAMAGTAVFAISGALMGLRKSMDIVGVSFVATVTGVGGGTVRDLLLGATPVKWVRDPTDIAICVICAVFVSLMNQPLLGQRKNWLFYADAIGLALFTILGAAKAEASGAHPFVAVLFGAMSASFGGIIRDIICNVTPIIFHKEIYITASLLGGGLFILLEPYASFEARAVAGLSAVALLRFLAIHFSWSLKFPRYAEARNIDAADKDEP